MSTRLLLRVELALALLAWGATGATLLFCVPLAWTVDPTDADDVMLVALAGAALPGLCGAWALGLVLEARLQGIALARVSGPLRLAAVVLALGVGAVVALRLASRVGPELVGRRGIELAPCVTLFVLVGFSAASLHQLGYAFAAWRSAIPRLRVRLR